MNKLLTYTLISSLMISTGSIYADSHLSDGDISIGDPASGQDDGNNILDNGSKTIGSNLPIYNPDRQAGGNTDGGGTVIDGPSGSTSLKCDKDGVCPMDAIGNDNGS